MPAIVKYPDAVRQQAVALHQQGKGYKAVASALGLPRDTVRGWIVSYRQTGRMEAVQTTGQIRKQQKASEALYAAARQEYETTDASLLSIAQKHGHNYNNLRYFLQQHHPESVLLHAYAKQSTQLRTELSAQVAALQEAGDQLLQQMRQELDQQLARLRK